MSHAPNENVATNVTASISGDSDLVVTCRALDGSDTNAVSRDRSSGHDAQIERNASQKRRRESAHESTELFNSCWGFTHEPRPAMTQFRSIYKVGRFSPALMSRLRVSDIGIADNRDVPRSALIDSDPFRLSSRAATSGTHRAGLYWSPLHVNSIFDWKRWWDQSMRQMHEGWPQRFALAPKTPTMSVHAIPAIRPVPSWRSVSPVNAGRKSDGSAA
jgi:hypothetical protein